MKLPLLSAVLVAALLPAAAQVIITESYSFTIGSPGGNIPDTGASTVFSQTLSSSAITSLTEVRVGLNLSGSPAGTGWAGDLFVSLNRDLGGQTAVLLNQVGVTTGNPVGHGYDGWSITLRDDAATDIHDEVLTSGVLSGSYQPDGRLSPTDSTRPALLGQFTGLAGNGAWYLHLADLASGGSMTLQSWSLELTGMSPAPVPEPAQVAGLTTLALAAFALARRPR